MLVYRTAERYELKVKSSSSYKVRNNKRSFCDYCGRQLKWYENIPVISWVIQKGKTRCCRKKLPVLYPIVELLMGILFVIFFRSQISDLRSQILILLIGLVILVVLVFSAVFDLKYMILPDVATGILIGCALILLLLGRHIGLPLHYVLMALVSGGFLLILHLITKGKGMGMGDVKLAFFMGLFLGYPKIIVAMYTAFIVGALVGVILLMTKKVKRKTPIPFGPFLILGTLVAWFFGNSI